MYCIFRVHPFDPKVFEFDANGAIVTPLTTAAPVPIPPGSYPPSTQALGYTPGPPNTVVLTSGCIQGNEKIVKFFQN